MSDSRRRGSMELPPDLPEQTPSTAEDHESERRQALELPLSSTDLFNNLLLSLALEGTGIERRSMDLPPDLPEQTPSTAEDHESERRQALELHLDFRNLSMRAIILRQVLRAVTGIERRSMELPPDLPERRQLYSSAEDLLNHEASVRQALREFNDILDELNKADKMLEDIIKKEETFVKIMVGTAGVLVVAIGVIAAPFTGGTSMAVATAAASAAGAAGLGSSAVGIKDNLLYENKIKKIAKKVEAWVKKFLEIVEQLEKDLVKIKSLSEKLQESTVMIVATVTLKKVEEVQEVLQQLSGSQKISELLRRRGLVDSVVYLRTVCQKVRSRSDEVLTKLEELRSAVKACRDQSMSSIDELKPPSD